MLPTDKLGSNAELIQIRTRRGEDLNSRVATIDDVDFLLVVDENVSGKTKLTDAFAFPPEREQRSDGCWRCR